MTWSVSTFPREEIVIGELRNELHRHVSAGRLDSTYDRYRKAAVAVGGGCVHAQIYWGGGGGGGEGINTVQPCMSPTLPD